MQCKQLMSGYDQSVLCCCGGLEWLVITKGMQSGNTHKDLKELKIEEKSKLKSATGTSEALVEFTDKRVKYSMYQHPKYILEPMMVLKV
jgi:hypothetical protein